MICGKDSRMSANCSPSHWNIRLCNGSKRNGVVSYRADFSGSEVNDISIHVKERWDTGTLAIDLITGRSFYFGRNGRVI
ncbi:hypothetical protein PO124_23795 [Bacillus licheniformis]|nr:hypothetical protein [Bacillus licheniformis]